MKNSLLQFLSPSQMGVLIGIFVLAFTIPVGVYLATQQERPTSLLSRAGLSGNTQLFLWPAKIEVPVCPPEASLSSCPATKIQVTLNTRESAAGGVDVVLKYDPAMVRVVNNTIYPGSVDDSFTPLLQVFDYYRDGEVDSRNGQIKIKSSGSFNGQNGIVATFFVNGLSSGESRIEFLAGQQFVDGTKVWDENEKNNILGSVEGATVSVK